MIAQPNASLLTGLWRIQTSEAGLITDPMAIGGVGAALLNAALVLLLSLLLIRRMKLPITGAALACLFLMAGFALLGKNLLNITPIVIGGWLHALYKRESFARYVYLILYGTCLSPMVSFLLVRVRPGFRWLAMSLCGLVIGFLLPAIARYTTRVHQGYNLYNVGFAAGILGLGLASFFKGFGVEFTSHDSWSREGHLLLCGLMTALLGGLLAAGIRLGCRSWRDYRRVLRHSGRAVADFILLDGPARTLVNMALVGGVGFAYLLALYPLGVRLNGPLVCCLFAMTGFGAFGKHPRNVLPVMAGAVLASLLMIQVPITSHVVSELNHAMLLAGCRELNLRLVREEEGLRLHIRGGFAPENRAMVERMAALLQPAVRDPALVETYWELAGEDQYTSDSEMSLVGQMLDGAQVEIGPGEVRMELYLAF